MKFYVLQRWFNACNVEQMFEIGTIEAEDEEEAWEIIEESWSDTNSQEWLLTEEAFNKLKEILK